jgi:hypothetical protein
VKSSKGEYYLVDQNGNRSTLQTNGQDLSKLVDHQVTVTGKADTSRAAGSDAKGHRAGYFSVDSVNDQGPCKK